MLVPELDLMLLADIALVGELGAIFVGCTRERNKLSFARSRLDIQDHSDRTRLARFEEHFASRIQEVVAQGETICRQAGEITVDDRAHAAWDELWHEARVLLHSLADATTVDETYVAQPMLQASPLDPLFFYYLNHQYR